MDYAKVPQEINNIVGDNVNLLAQLFPSAVKDGQVDLEALKEELGQFEEVDKEKYELTWAGKQDAKKKAQEDVYNRTLNYIESDSKNPETTENLYIEGDNLEVLKLLRQNYYGAIKMIYIDPPYNTGSDFLYNDNFAMSSKESDILEGTRDDEGNPLQRNQQSSNRFHANWLNMIYPRLKVAKDLLTDDGVIFISIDDNELENLINSCNEIFNERNFVGVLSVENNPKGRKNSDFISVSSEYCVIYAKNKANTFFVENVPKKASDMTLDADGNYVHNSGKRVLVGENNFNNKVTNVSSDKNYSVYFREDDKSVKLVKEEINESDSHLISQGYYKYYSYHNGELIENTYTAKKFMELFEENALDFSNGKIYEKNFNDTIRIKSQLVNREYEAIVNGKKQNYSMELTTTGAGTYLKQLFQTEEVLFSAPKNNGFLKLLISLFENTDFIFLDFFSGSATSADAVMRLNAEDGGNRKFIMVQFPEDLDTSLKTADTIAKKTIVESIKFLGGINKAHNICEIGKERIHRAGEGIKKEIETSNVQLKIGEEPKLIPDIGFKVFRTADTNIKWNLYDALGQIDTNAMTHTPDLADFTVGFKDIDVVYEVMLRQKDVPLSSTLETLTDIGNRTYLYGSAYLVCLETDINEELIDKLAALDPLPIKFVFRDSAFKDDINLKDETFRRLKNLIERNSGLAKKSYTVEFI